MVRKYRWIIVFIIFSFVIAGASGIWVYYQFTQPGSLKVDTVIIIPKGRGIDFISRLLSRKGIIAQPMVFKIGVVALGLDKVIQAGEYSIPKASSPINTLKILRSGKTVVRRFLAPEGLYTSEILNRLRETDGLIDTVKEVIKEGELLPETYHFSFGDSRNDLVRRMKAAMKKTSRNLWLLRKPGLPFATLEEAIILASIVEKETGLTEERPRISRVFINRLKLGMRLQSDPTVIYGLTKGQFKFKRPLNRKDLKKPNPYNTYLNKGLPPGPIANPGRASIEAVMHPIDSEELYFVADGKGGHAFAKSLDEHNKNVSIWRKIEVERRKDGKKLF